MKKLKFKAVLATALAVALVGTTALAAPVIASQPDPQAAAYTIEARNSVTPIMVWGTVDALGEKSVALKNSNKGAAYSEITLNVHENTMILDAVSGDSKTFADLKKGASLYAYVGPAMTRSIPPAAAATLILCNIPADYRVPTYAEIKSITKDESGKISALTDRDVILHLNEETKLMPYETKNVVSLDDVRPGTRVLAWYSVVALSMPAQATPTKVMVFPYSYESVVTATDTTLTLNGDMAIDGKVENSKLLVPMRKLAEALGCTVEWTAEGNTVAVTKGEKALYNFVIGASTVTVNGSEVALVAPAAAPEGVTYIAIDDLLTLQNLKLG